MVYIERYWDERADLVLNPIAGMLRFACISQIF